ncbi:hypothetical protein KIW84_066475 [Lathyrus oleraceus]|uniref:Chromo domain-containing protein n=1 Tax=Pisum sativum TaxID=3888 RepID=A0A9D5A8M9_PEA|nr:hypothetical protein KIW84_066475 [Pisum sativum]
MLTPIVHLTIIDVTPLFFAWYGATIEMDGATKTDPQVRAPRVTVGGWSSVLFRFWVSVNYCNRGIATHTEFLVRWDGVPYSEATWAWEPEDTLKTLYLHLNLEDKVVRGELGNDTHLGQKMKGMYDTSDIGHSKITKGTHRVRKRPA